MLPFVPSRSNTPSTGIHSLNRSARGLTLLGYATLIFGFGTFASWAAFAEISSAVIARGTVGVESTRKPIEHQTGGTVATLEVADGDTVSKGQLLLSLDASVANANLRMLTARLIKSSIRVERLKAEAAHNDDFSMSSEALFEALEQDVNPEDSKDNVYAVLSAEKEIFRTRLALRRQQIKQLDVQEKQYLAHQAMAKQRYDALKDQIDRTSAQIEKNRGLVTKGAMSKATLIDRMGALTQLQNGLSAVEIETADAESSLGNITLQRLKMRQTVEDDSSRDLSDVMNEMESLRPQLQAARAALAQLDIRATQSGVVQDLKVHSVGAVVPPGVPIMEIVPTTDSLTIAMALPVNLADQVRPGMEATLRFSNLQASRTLQMTGTILRISPDAVRDENGRRTIVNGEVSLNLASAPPELVRRLRPGIEAEIIVPTAQRSVASYLLSPLTDAMAHSMREK